MYVNLIALLIIALIIYSTFGFFEWISLLTRGRQYFRIIPDKELDDFFARFTYRAKYSDFIGWKFESLVDQAPTVSRSVEGVFLFPFLPQYEVGDFGMISPFSRWTKFFNAMKREAKKAKIHRIPIKTLYTIK